MDIKHKRIGFIGTGVMGSGMIHCLQKEGFNMHIFTRTKEKAISLIKEGATWEKNIETLVQKVDVLITMVGYPNDVEEIYFGNKGILENIVEGSYLIDMTTSKPSLAKKIYDIALKKGGYALDAPVSGGDIGAKQGTLSIMVGGNEQAFQTVRPILEAMGKNIILQGGPGAGQHTKLSNQIAIASNMIGVSEAILYAKKAGLDPVRVLDSITSGAAGSWSLSNLAPRMIVGDDEPGFYVKHFIKDMKIALESAEEMGLNTPGLALSLRLYQELAEKGYGDRGTQALIKLFEQKSIISHI